jgi:outer membrane protein TolC
VEKAVRCIVRSSNVLPLLSVAALVAVSAARAQPALSFDEALRIAAGRSQQIVAEQAAATAAREMAVSAAEAPDPMLTAGVTNVPVTGDEAFSLTRDFMTMRSIGLSRELTHGDKRHARSERFVREAEAAEAASNLALADLQRGAALAWLERSYQERARAVLLEQREQAALQIDAADVAFRSGLGSEADVLAARLSVAKIDDRIAENARDIEVATVDLARWIGADATRPLGQAPPTDMVSLHGGDLESALAHHPEIELMTKQEEVALAEADLARAAKRSDWTVEVEYSQRGPDYSNMMSVNFSKPLQWRERNRQDRDVAAKLALASRARAEREEAVREHVADATALLARWNANHERLSRYSATLVPLASERTLAATAAYRGGGSTLGEVLEARVAEIDTRLDQLMLASETAALWAELTFLVPAGVAHE